LSKENEIVNLNIKQIENSKGNDKELKNDIVKNGKQVLQVVIHYQLKYYPRKQQAILMTFCNGNF
jgi:hypothetical protein